MTYIEAADMLYSMSHIKYPRWFPPQGHRCYLSAWQPAPIPRGGFLVSLG